jgi:hypothetical protein
MQAGRHGDAAGHGRRRAPRAGRRLLPRLGRPGDQPVTDLLLAFPFLILAVGLAAILGPSLRNVVIALGISALPSFIRVTRGEVLGLREQDYVAGAVADGAGDVRILSRYVLPNAISPLLVQATVTVPEAIIGESVLSFLGLGVQPPTPSWGTMLSAAQSFLTQAPLLAVWPASRSRSRPCRSTSSVTACATPSTRGLRDDHSRLRARAAGPAGSALLSVQDLSIPLRDRGTAGARRQTGCPIDLAAGEILALVGESGAASR